jgi:uncharacterized protein YggU (UPF0235/DUF167 family)
MYVRVHAKPDSRRERVTKESETVFYIEVKEPAERNLANKRIREILASVFAIAPAQIRIVTGHHSSSKIYDVDR